MDKKSEVTRSVIVGVDIPFWELVKLIIKYSFAAIPAMFIIGAIFTGPFLLLGVVFPEWFK
tara:strand:+ start:822 stop:1004 length:183 start_codon:yes stop_codon:yes gene_type:complete